MSIQVLLFSPNLPPAGVLTHCELSNDAMHIAEYHQSVTFNQMRASVGGFDHDQLQLHWQNHAGDNMVVPANKVAQKKLTQLLQPHQIQDFSQWKVATKSQSAVWNALLYGAGVLVLLLAIGIWRYDDVLTWAANRVSIETENKMGEAVLASYNKQHAVIISGAAVDFVNKLGGELTAGSHYHYQWLVVHDDAINAFAMPGGIVIVNTGLLKAADQPDEVAAVLAHEVQHVEQKHALKNMLNSAGVATVVMLVLGDANTAMILVAHQISTQFFSRKVEAEADAKGLALLLKKNINGEGMATFFKKLAKLNPTQSDIPEWVSSHPDTKNRILAADAFVKNHPCANCQTLRWDHEAIINNINAKTLEDDKEE
jgi:beta-barrel assembly-enhancing protease